MNKCTIWQFCDKSHMLSYVALVVVLHACKRVILSFHLHYAHCHFKFIFFCCPTMWCRNYSLWLYLCYNCSWFLLC